MNTWRELIVQTKNKKNEYDLSVKENILITTLLYVSYCEDDYETRNSVMTFCSHNLSDKQFKKIYKSCIKFLKRLDQDTEEFNKFLQTIG